MDSAALHELRAGREAAAQSGGQPRMPVVDVAKGIAILLMVLGHTEQGGMHRAWWSAMGRLPGVIRFADAYIYSFHMAVFFFVGGLFVERSLARRSVGAFTLEKAKTLLYPYALWGVAGGLLLPLTARFHSIAQPTDWRSLVFGLLTGNESWFLPSFFVSLLCAVALRRLPRWAQLAVAVAASVAVPNRGIALLFAPFYYLPFVISGSWLGTDRMRRLEQVPRVGALAAFAALAAAQGAAIAASGAASRWTNVPLGLAGAAMVLLLSRALAQGRAGRVLAWCGAASLAIFVLSPFVQGAAREMVLRLLHTTAPLPQLAIPVLLAAGLPALAWHARQPLHIAWMFRWPEEKNGCSALTVRGN